MLGIIGARLAETRTVDEVFRVLNELALRVVPASSYCAYRLDSNLEPTVTVTAPNGLSEQFLHEYRRLGHADEVLMKKLVQRRTPVTEADAGSERTVCARSGMGRILIAPLFSDHGVSGSLNFVRPTGARPFAPGEQLNAFGLASQASLAIARCEGSEPPGSQLDGLTPREFELLKLLARGLSNRELAARKRVSEHAIHQALKRLYRKLDVHSRAAAVATLFAAQGGSVASLGSASAESLTR